ncbi:MAG: type II secretion system protein [Patescibacteria group bacterium]|nr:type II secretion system GspH family protein [Patescibacteria group bacterium]
MIHIHNRLKRGFTLLELLVVISIIGILLAIGTTAFTTAQKRGRDARRLEDIKSMQNAFEQYYAQNGGYDVCAAMVIDFMTGDSMPEDPKPGWTAYSCVGDAGTDTYCVCAKLEDMSSGNSAVSCGFSGVGYYCLENLQ